MKRIQSLFLLLAILAVGLGIGKRFHEESSSDDTDDGESVFVSLDHPQMFLG